MDTEAFLLLGTNTGAQTQESLPLQKSLRNPPALEKCMFLGHCWKKNIHWGSDTVTPQFSCVAERNLYPKIPLQIL